MWAQSTNNSKSKKHHEKKLKSKKLKMVKNSYTKLVQYNRIPSKKGTLKCPCNTKMFALTFKNLSSKCFLKLLSGICHIFKLVV